MIDVERLKVFIKMMKKEGVVELDMHGFVKLKLTDEALKGEITSIPGGVNETDIEKRERLRQEKEDSEEDRFYNVEKWDDDIHPLPLKGVD